MIIHLIRHGQTTGDLENRYGGDYEDHLTELGEQQAAELADWLAARPIELLYASPRLRAQEAAAIIGKQLSLTPKTFEDFRERNGYGILTGMIKEEAARLHPEQVAFLQQDPIRHTVTGAEPYTHFRKRILAALTAVAQEPYREVAVVSHGGPIRLIFRDVLQLGEITIADRAYVGIASEAGEYKLQAMHGIKLQKG